MAFPVAYLSRPGVVLPAARLSNDDVVQRIRARYGGSEQDWPRVEAGIRTVFERCNSQYRHIEEDAGVRVGDFAAQAARACLDTNGVAATAVDLVVYGGIAREYFEPATAMEVAAKVGVREPVHAFDVTSACAGLLEAVQIGCAYLAMNPRIETVLVAAGELTRQFLGYDVQSPAELETKVAGLTIGNAAAAWLVRREPFANGCARILDMNTFSLPSQWGLCQAPIDGTFTSHSHELFKLNSHVPGEIQRLLARVGWTVADVDHFVFHQPSDHMVSKVLRDLGDGADQAVRIHHLYGNTSSTTVAVAMNHLLAEREVRGGDRLVFCSAAAGFSMVTAVAEWVA